MTTTNDNDIEVPFIEKKLDSVNGLSASARAGLNHVGGEPRIEVVFDCRKCSL